MSEEVGVMCFLKVIVQVGCQGFMLGVLNKYYYYSEVFIGIVKGAFLD